MILTFCWQTFGLAFVKLSTRYMCLLAAKQSILPCFAALPQAYSLVARCHPGIAYPECSELMS